MLFIHKTMQSIREKLWIQNNKNIPKDKENFVNLGRIKMSSTEIRERMTEVKEKALLELLNKSFTQAFE